MQTFLPFPNFHDSLRTLDSKRLGNQIYREALTLARGGWPNHPASKMWRGHERSLCDYALAGLDVLAERGKYYPQHRTTFLALRSALDDTGAPPWLGDHAFHESHQSNLLRKDPAHYGQFGWTVPDDLPYVWPKPVTEVA
jgi:hypothetical protein